MLSYHSVSSDSEETGALRGDAAKTKCDGFAHLLRTAGVSIGDHGGPIK